MRTTQVSTEGISDAEPGGPSESRTRPPGIDRRTSNLLALLGYASCSAAVFGFPVLGRLSSAFVGAGQNDAKLYVWCLTWWPHAIAAATNPFFPRVIYAPQGVNMAWVTGIPGPAMVVSPITLTLGPIVSSNVLALLSPALSCFAAFVLCRHVTKAFWPSFLAGLAFGFSTYEVAQMHGHLNLTLVFPVPLCAYLVLRLFEGSLSARRFVPLMALLLVAEFSTSTEIFATMTMFGGIAILFALLVLRGEQRGRLVRATQWLAASYVVSAIVLSPYLYYVFAHSVPSNFHSPAVAASDLLSYVVPRRGTLVGGRVFSHITRHFTQGVVGDGAYLGVPLLGAMGLWWVRHRREPAARILFLTFATVVVFSLGSVLHVDGRALLGLPWALVAKIPVIQKAIPSRFGLYAALISALVLACWLTEHRGSVTAWGAAGISVLVLLPNVFLPIWHEPASVPAFFSTGLYRRYLAPGETTIVIPYRGGEPMLWQAETHMYFRMAGGYVGTKPASYQPLPAVHQLSSGIPGAVDSSELLTFAYSRHVGAILIDDHLAASWKPVLSVFHVSPIEVGGITLYRLS